MSDMEEGAGCCGQGMEWKVSLGDGLVMVWDGEGSEIERVREAQEDSYALKASWRDLMS